MADPKNNPQKSATTPATASAGNAQLDQLRALEAQAEELRTQLGAEVAGVRNVVVFLRAMEIYATNKLCQIQGTSRASGVKDTTEALKPQLTPDAFAKVEAFIASVLQ